MASFTLPSGRIVELQEPTYGDLIHATSIGMDRTEDFHYAKFAAVAPQLSREEVGALSRADGTALAKEVNRLFHGRPVEKDIPFGKRSQRAQRV